MKINIRLPIFMTITQTKRCRLTSSLCPSHTLCACLPSAELTEMNAVYMVDPPSKFVRVSTTPGGVGKVFNAKSFRGPLKLSGGIENMFKFETYNDKTATFKFVGAKDANIKSLICMGGIQRRSASGQNEAAVGTTVYVCPVPTPDVLASLTLVFDPIRLQHLSDEEKNYKQFKTCRFLQRNPDVCFLQGDLVCITVNLIAIVQLPAGVTQGLFSPDETSLTILPGGGVVRETFSQ